jgi:rhomboid family GlyGly-CTERM serine protease
VNRAAYFSRSTRVSPRAGALFIAVAAVVCLGLALTGDAGRDWLQFDRGALESWQLWRLVSAHLVHLGWLHALLNVAALALIVMLFGDCLRLRELLLAALIAALTIDGGLYFLSPAVQWYVGLSGVLHGLVLFGALTMAKSSRGMGLSILVALLAKVGYEQWLGPLPLTAGAVEGPVLIESHLFGLVGGVIALASRAIVRSRFPGFV